MSDYKLKRKSARIVTKQVDEPGMLAIPISADTSTSLPQDTPVNAVFVGELLFNSYDGTYSTIDGADNTIILGTSGNTGGGSSYTFSNGLTLDIDDVSLGGTLTEPTTTLDVDGNGFQIINPFLFNVGNATTFQVNTAVNNNYLRLNESNFITQATDIYLTSNNTILTSINSNNTQKGVKYPSDYSTGWDGTTPDSMLATKGYVDANAGGGGGATYLGDLRDVIITSPLSGQYLKYTGTEWVNSSTSGTSLNPNFESITFDGSLETIGSTITLNHSLNTNRFIVQVWDDVTNEMIGAEILNPTNTTIDLIFNGSIPQNNITVNLSAGGSLQNSNPNKGSYNTINRPLVTEVNVGDYYFDIDFGYVMWSNGNQWVNATGQPNLTE